MWVFPGGRVDAEDYGDDPDDIAAAEQRAAAREALEEAGLAVDPAAARPLVALDAAASTTTGTASPPRSSWPSPPRARWWSTTGRSAPTSGSRPDGPSNCRRPVRSSWRRRPTSRSPSSRRPRARPSSWQLAASREAEGFTTRIEMDGDHDGRAVPRRRRLRGRRHDASGAPPPPRDGSTTDGATSAIERCGGGTRSARVRTGSARRSCRGWRRWPRRGCRRDPARPCGGGPGRPRHPRSG